jgi:hypothetical protein
VPTTRSQKASPDGATSSGHSPPSAASAAAGRRRKRESTAADSTAAAASRRRRTRPAPPGLLEPSGHGAAGEARGCLAEPGFGRLRRRRDSGDVEVDGAMAACWLLPRCRCSPSPVDKARRNSDGG